MNDGLKRILEQLYEQAPDIEALKEALISLVHTGELSIDDIKVLDNHYAAETLFDPISFMSFVILDNLSGTEPTQLVNLPIDRSAVSVSSKEVVLAYLEDLKLTVAETVK